MVPRGVLCLTLLVVSLSTTTGCRKKPAAGSATLDASADADTPDGAAVTTPAAATASASSTSSTSSTESHARPAATVTSMFEGQPLPPATPFAGSYRCLKGLQLAQAGSIVTGTVHTTSTLDTVIACTAGPDTCTGTMREIQQTRGKAPKVLHVKPITLQRSPSGDILIKPATGPDTVCRKS